MASASVSTIEAAISRTGDVETGVVCGSKVGIKQFGRTVDNVDRYLFTEANFYIRESRRYFNGCKLTRYVYFSKILHYVYLFIFTMVGAVLNFIAALLMMLLNIPYLIMFTQHMYVNIQTMRYVLKQPEVPDDTLAGTTNSHLEITLEEFAASYAATQQAGLGLIVHGKGTVKIQVFTESAKTKMKNCIWLSTLYFLGAFLGIVCCLIFVIIGVVNGGGLTICYISRSSCRYLMTDIY